MKNNANFKENVAPALVLFIICLVVTFALAATDTTTTPKIAAIKKANADAARAVVLSSAKENGKAEFNEYKGKLVDGVIECYTAKNKSGIAITAQAPSFGGLITVMVGIDKDGKVKGVTVTDHKDTPGLGTLAMDAGYLKQYNNCKKANADNIKDDGEIKAITGATISSNGIYQSVRHALAQYKEMGGVK